MYSRILRNVVVTVKTKPTPIDENDPIQRKEWISYVRPPFNIDNSLSSYVYFGADTFLFVH